IGKRANKTSIGGVCPSILKWEIGMHEKMSEWAPAYALLIIVCVLVALGLSVWGLIELFRSLL
ncbi:MAG TPA: hypothetical protein VK603_24190, partial [Candidatus Saccharimonadales bacterium]|nr:hypothetical protein [Candidatus Saccharimonadales bacterium]